MVAGAGGGHFVIQAEAEAGGACTAALRLELLDADGARLALSSGVCPSIGPDEAFNLRAGRHYLRVSADSTATDYRLSIRAVGPRCDNGRIETQAHETCDGGAFCTAACTPSVAIMSDAARFPTTAEVPADAAPFRIALTMSQRGWVDIGTGDYLYDACASDTTVIIEDEDLNELFRDEDSGPGACARVVRELPAGKYFARVVNDGAEAFELHYAAHLWGQCGDKVLNPLAGEACDEGTRSGTSSNSCSSSCTIRPTESSSQIPIDQCAQTGSATGISSRYTCELDGEDTGAAVEVGVNVFSPIGWYVYYERISCGGGGGRVGRPRSAAVICAEDERQLDADPIGPAGALISFQ